VFSIIWNVKAIAGLVGLYRWAVLLKVKIFLANVQIMENSALKNG
jgi:hypothetical protein